MKGPFLVFALLLLAGCSGQIESRDGKTSVVVSIPPQAGLLRAITDGQDMINIMTLVGEGQSPHTYEPTAKQLARLGSADLFFTIGVPFEKPLIHKIQSIYPALPVYPSQTDVPLRTMGEEHDHEDGEACTGEHGAPDPHIWLSPANAAQIARNMCAELCSIDPEHESLYRKNTDSLIRQLQDLDMALTEKLRPFQGSRFYVFHPSFGYFADAYDLEQVPVEIDGKSPSPRLLAELIDQAREDGIRIIFVQKQFPMGSARSVADAIGGEVVQLDPLAEDVVANIGRIADSIKQALQQ